MFFVNGIAGLLNGVGSSAWFNRPNGIVLNSNGVPYMADTGSAVIRAVALAGSVTTLDLSSGAFSAKNSDIVPAITQIVATSGTSAPGLATSGSGNSGVGGGEMNGGTVLALTVACFLRARLLMERSASAEPRKLIWFFLKWNGWAGRLNRV